MSRPPSEAPAYPVEQEAEVVLRDGSTVHVRPVRSDDEAGVREFVQGISPDSIAFRFFGLPSVEWITAWSLEVDYVDRFALVVETGSPRRIVAHAAYIRSGPETAEVAFLVTDAWQSRGISSILLAHLAGIADRHGIRRFTAIVLPANHRMIEVFRTSGFPVEIHSGRDGVVVEFPTSLSPEALARFAEREHVATVAAVSHFLAPRSVAVIGASRRRGTVGGEVMHNIVSSDFQGPVYAINPHTGTVQGLPAFTSIAEVPEPVELAVVVVPAEQVTLVARDCARAGVRGLLVISSGFAEIGGEGAARQAELVAICRDSGMRLIGPNCLGVLNTAPGVCLNATFAPHRAIPGGVGFMSQSGGLGIAIIEASDRLGIGLSSFVSVGNKADLSGNDLIRYWQDDPNTRVGLLYLESFGNGRKFARIAPRFARRKPLLAVKSGRSPAGARATSSHTGALLAASDATVDALFEQAGVIRAESLDELLAVASLLDAQPVPPGARVAIVTNAGGPGIMCADACQANGAAVEELPAPVQARLREFLPASASVLNPIDMIATASGEDYRRTMETLIEADACDAILAIFVPPLVTEAGDVARAIREVAESRPAVTLAAVFMASEAPPADLRAGAVRVPAYQFPEQAARAVAQAARYGAWRARPEPEPLELPGIRRDKAAAVISTALGADREWLPPAELTELLDCYGIPLIDTRVVRAAAEAAAAASEIGFPVAIKGAARGLIHKTDAGAVRLALADADAVARAAGEIEAQLAAEGYQLDGFVIQRMAQPGVELIVGVVNDRNFGPVMACGAGGVTAELIKDVSVRLTPLARGQADEMIRSLKTFPLLDGYRGAPKCDIGAVADVLLRVSALVEGHPEIAELDCNPLIVRPEGAVVVDARIRVEAAPAASPVPSLRA